MARIKRRRSAKRKRVSPEKSMPAAEQSNGFALTVFQSPEIERFDVDLQGELPDGGVAGIDLLLARASGSRIDQVGGVPYGASGSPVYVQDKLIGAISTSFYPDSKLVGITPIDAMRAIGSESTPTPPVPSTAKGSLPGSNFALPVANGVKSHRALAALEKRFGRRFVPSPESALLQKMQTTTPQPGSSIGIGLITGDIKIGLIGTTTFVDGDNLFALGHPAFFSGPTELPLQNAVILDVARGEDPSKVGALGDIIGTVVQDRSAGILAVLNRMPHLVQMEFSITDLDRDQTTQVQAQVVPLPSFLPGLAFTATMESFVRAMNRIGQGTARWKWSVQVQNAPEPIEEASVAFSPFDIGFTVALAGEALLNGYVEQGLIIEKVTLEATVEAADTTANRK